jgi:formylmethanofuran dehydrogenase subunit E
VRSEADGRTESVNVERVAVGTEDFRCLLEKARDLHGHLGPFLVVGVRAGLRGLRELQTRKENLDVSATARLIYSVPYSCILDGIQVATGCTIGNQRLKFENSTNLTIQFWSKAGRTATITILPEAVEELRRELVRELSSEEVAYKAASLAEEELFKVALR